MFRGSFAVVKVGIPKDGSGNVAIKIIDKKVATLSSPSQDKVAFLLFNVFMSMSNNPKTQAATSFTHRDRANEDRCQLGKGNSQVRSDDTHGGWQDAQFDKESLEMEIQIMKKVDHPNCIKLHEVRPLPPCACSAPFQLSSLVDSSERAGVRRKDEDVPRPRPCHWWRAF